MKVKFAYYWLMPGESPAAFYKAELSPGNVSDITGESLLAKGIPIPPTPTFNTWQRMVFERLRCGFCWTEINGTFVQLEQHVWKEHPRQVAS